MKYKIYTMRRRYPLVTFMACLLILLSIAFFNPFPFDSIAYHIPFSVNSIYPHYFDLDIGLRQRFNGFPPLWRYIMAPFLLTGCPRMLIIPNILSLFLLVYTCKNKLGLSINIAIIAIFSTPIVLSNFVTSYQDFFVNTTLTNAFINLFTEDNLKSGKQIRYPLVLLCVASLVKFQGYILSMTVFLIFCISLLANHEKRSYLKSIRIMLLIFLAVASSKYLLNLFEFQNPFYPVEIQPFFKGPERQYQAIPDYLDNLGLFSKPIAYILSITEIDWILRGVQPNYSFDMSSSGIQTGGLLQVPPENNLVRTGGTFGPFYLVIIFIYILPILRLAVNKSLYLDYKPKQLYIASISLILIVAFMPQSHELRYYLIVPLLMTLTVLSICTNSTNKWPSDHIVKVLTIMAIISAVIVFCIPVATMFTRELKTQSGFQYASKYPLNQIINTDQCINRSKVISQYDSNACRIREFLRISSDSHP